MVAKKRSRKRRVSSAPRLSVARNGKAYLDPWQLVWGQPYIDCDTLAAAIEQDLKRAPAPDFRTRLLVRDAIRAIRSYWGPQKFANWLLKSSIQDTDRK